MVVLWRECLVPFCLMVGYKFRFCGCSSGFFMCGAGLGCMDVGWQFCVDVYLGL